MRIVAFFLLISTLALGMDFSSYVKFNALRSDYVEVSNFKDLNIDRGFTISSWIYFDEALPEQVVWELEGNKCSFSFTLAKHELGLMPVLELQCGNQKLSAKVVDGSILKGWQFVTVVYNGVANGNNVNSERLQLLIDAQPKELEFSAGKDVKIQVPTILTAVSKFYIGSDSQQKKCYNGRIGDLAIWQGAKSLPFITALYNEPIKISQLKTYDGLGA
ncbi:MAG: LamG-like jellyroll fold domain-containing protein, partial [Lentisphaeria bacterium]